MNEFLSLAPALAAGLIARRIFLRRPLVDGSQGRFVPTAGALVFGSLLLRMSITLRDFISSAR
jgi:hypothetical protein